MDKMGKAVLYTGTAPPVEREAYQPPHVRTKRGADVIRPCNPVTETTCYCTPLGKCFNVVQEIKIDHCWIDRYAGRPFQVLYSVRNWANLVSTPQQQMDLGELGPHDIRCRPSILTTGAILGIVIGILLGLAILALLIFILVTLIRVRVYHKPMPHRLQTINDRFRGETIQRDNSLYASAGACNSGVTPAKRQNATEYAPPPYKKYDDGSAVESVAVADDDDIYVYGTVPKRDIEYGTKIGEGKFAMIVKARVGEQDVAAKCLRNGHNTSDAELMKRKVEFLKDKVPAHVNIVRYVGDEQDDPEKGPVLLLELCEMPLHDWLKKVGKVDVDALENMLTFTINIAHGVEHLHKHQVVHKRLSARNVLLVKSLGVYVAKLIGFGPSKADEGAAKKVPLKWLAPETLDSLNGVPIYNKKTDAWTFGVVVMEIYSQGADPYPEIKSDEVAAYLKSGKRMSSPQHLSAELYDTVVTPCWNVTPSARPSFDQICRDIEEFRSGGEDGDDRGYYAPTAAGDGKNLTARYDDCRS